MSRVVQPVSGWPAPAELLRKLSGMPDVFLLDSAWPSRTAKTYSFLGFSPILKIRATSRRVVVSDLREGQKEEVTDDTSEAPKTILEKLRFWLKAFSASAHPEIPFTGGAVGYFSYELGAAWERVAARADSVGAASGLRGGDEPEVLWAEFSFYDSVLAYAHETSQWFCIGNDAAGRDANEIVGKLTREVSHALRGENGERGAASSGEELNPAGWVEPRENRQAYLAAVDKIKGYIAAGDIYQVNLAQEFSGKWRGSAAGLYQRLRARTPAPFGAFLTTRDGHLLSSSPESFLRLRADVLETRPIKGTRARGQVADEKQITELVESPKERAELLMIVDLERNDLARVCRPGSIEVTELYGLETHPTVFHLVATVRGRLAPGKDALDALRAMFPGGSITGAPKIRAMQIIRELEKTARGPYTGAIGYFGFDGSADFNIAIRTVKLTGENVSYHVGAGIVWDSNPESEYEETLAKGMALRAAVEGTGTKGART
jgi:para-aminobenzoate synthetase component 1